MTNQHAHSAPHHTDAALGGGYGKVYSYTLVTDPPDDYVTYAPYYLALIKLDDGALLTAQLTDIETEPAIGMRVEMVTRRLKTEGPNGVIAYGYKFRPAL